MKTVFTTGTFDMFHYGHLQLLKRAKQNDNFVIVGLNSDELIAYKKPMQTYEQRREILESIRFVDAVVPINNQNDKYNYIKSLGIDEFVIGSDYANNPDLNTIAELCSIRVLQRTPGISTTEIKNKYNTFVIDIDDTISITTNRDFINAEPINEVIDKINYLYDKGVYIILFTARGMASQNNNPVKAELKYRVITETWLQSHGVKYHELLFGKRNADAYVDDKSMSIEEFKTLGGVTLNREGTLNK